MHLFILCLRKSTHAIDWLTIRLGHIVAWLCALMAITVTAVVLLRAVLSEGSIAMQESVTYMHALVIMIASAYTLREEGHVRVDIFYHRFQPLTRRWVDLLGHIFFLLPTSVFIVLVSFDYVAASWHVRETSADAGGLPAIFLLKGLILVNGALLAMQSLAECARNLAEITAAND